MRGHDMQKCMSAQPDWDLYRSFLAVMTEGSLSAAARALNSTQPTIGRHVEALEQALGEPLFTRSASGLRPTETALALQPHAESMAAAAEALIRTASGEAGQVKGVIRLTASDIMAAEVLPPVLTRFHEAWPEVVIELLASNKVEDLLRRDADIAVRMARPTQEALLARRVGEVQIGLFAHRTYLEKHGTPDLFTDVGQTAIGFDREDQTLRALNRSNLPIERDAFAFRSDSDLAQLGALRAGFGIGGAQLGIARRDANLVQVLPGVMFDMEIWVVMHEDLKASRRMKLMFDHLVVELGDYAATSRA
jgi:DNA-binding transcriptional LysR family regulator